MKVFVAVYEHEYGSDVRVFGKQEDAYKWKDQIAYEWWDAEIPDEPMPETNIGDEYFKVMGERWGDAEYFSIHHTMVEGEPENDE